MLVGMSSPSLPYSQSLLWKLAQYYYLNRGQSTWLLSETPYVLTSNLQFAYQLAWVIHAALESESQLPERLSFLETGAGHGVFSLNFLKAFRDVCQLEKSDYFSRLSYWISDYSPRYLQEIAAQPLLQPLIESGQVQLLQLDITEIESCRNLSGERHLLPLGAFNAIFCNYVFDTLPLSVYQLRQGQLRQKWVSTRIEPNVPAVLPPQLYALKDTVFVSEYRATRAEEAESPWLTDFLQKAQEAGKSGLLPASEPSFRALNGLYGHLQPGGLLWLADKGYIGEAWLQAQDFWPQTYGLCVTHQVNFPLLGGYLHDLGATCFLDPVPKHQLKFLLAQKSQGLSERLKHSLEYHFVQTNRNESSFVNYVQDCDRLLRGQGSLF
jgi:hypothetical protein